MLPDTPVPPWLWRAVTWGFGLVLAGVIGLAAALSFGLADPPRAGPLLWGDDFKSATVRWTWITTAGAVLAPRDGALVADFNAPDQAVVALAGPAAAGDFTLEAAGAQTQGAPGDAAYGLVFAWKDATHYSAVLINGNGYAEAYRQAGMERTAWFAFQQWPHILYGAESNRVRVDVRGARLTMRINDELLGEFDGGAAGQIGVLARSASTAPGAGSGSAQVVFSWVRVWAPAPSRAP